MNIDLKFINQSNDPGLNSIVIFQKNLAADSFEKPRAWKVIKHCGIGYSHPFKFLSDLHVGAQDHQGNKIDSQLCFPGQLFQLIKTSYGVSLQYYGPGSSTREVHLRNNLFKGTVHAVIYRDNKILAKKEEVFPGQKAAFEFNSTIWIGAIPQIEEGQALDSAVLPQFNTELSLLGVVSADIVMTGGGRGPTATPYVFNLENVMYD